MMSMLPRRCSTILILCTSLLSVIFTFWIISSIVTDTDLEPLVPPLKSGGGYRHCAKRTNVAFLKTHKCASSSVQNILMRFGLKNNLNFVLPSAGNYLGRYMKYFRGMISNTPWEQAGLDYNIFCLHTIWNYAEVSATLGPDTIYLTIMRDPVDLFESLWNYAGLSAYYNTDIETFALSEKTGHLANRAYRNLGRNQMLWDLGLPENQMDNQTAVVAKLEEAERTFHLVMMADRFDESMILLRDLLCWDYRDVINFKLNARKETRKTRLSEKARAALKTFLASDYLLYDHFRERFDKKVSQFGLSRMATELGILRHAKENMEDVCAITPTDNNKVSSENRLWGGEGLVAYTSNNDGHPDCRLFGMSEMNFIDMLRDVQAVRASESVASDTYSSEDRKVEVVYPLNHDVLADIKRLQEVYIHKVP